MSDRAAEYLSRVARMETDRMVWMTQWDSVAKYCCPRKGNILTKTTPGTPQTIDLYDSTAEKAGGIFAAGCVTHICPAGEKWLRLEPKKKENAPATVAEWFDRATDAVMDRIYASNFYENIHEDFTDAGHFATSCLLADEDPIDLVNFVNVPVGTFSIEENCRGRVDVVARSWKWTARQAEQKWGRDKLGPQQQKALAGTDPNSSAREFTYIHFIEPRKGSGYEGGAVTGTKRPIAEVYLCKEDNQIIDEGGFYSMPIFVNRLLRSNQEVYGRGPGIQALPDVRIVNTMMRDYLIALEKLANPGWLQGDDQSAQIDNRPNGMSYWDTSNPAGKPEQMQLKNQVRDLKEMLDEQRQIIRDWYYVPLFQMLTNMDEAKREKTAYEVQQMVAEKLLLFSPIFGRMTREKLNPIVERVFDIMARGSHAAWAAGQDGLLPLPPPEMKEFPGYNVVYVSKIALAIKAAENQSFATMMTLVEQAAAIDPTAAFLLDIPESLRRVGRNVGLPSKLMRPKREFDQKVAAYAQQQQQAAAPQQSELATRAVKNLGPQAQEAAGRKIIQSQGQAA